MKSSSLRPGSCRSLAMVLSVLVTVFVTGCFDSPDKSKLSCTTNDYCPHGEVCIGARGTVPGICGKPIDGGGIDASLALDGASAIDGSGGAIDGAGDRGANDTSPTLDGVSTIDSGGGTIDSANDWDGNDVSSPLDVASALDSRDAPLDSANDGGGMDQMETGRTDASTGGPDVVTAPDLPIQTPEVGGSCTSSTDCPGLCQTCSTGHVCVAVVGQDDPSGRCAGTCDGAGVCKSKKGQSCQSVAAGCASGTTCSPDGICCDTACTGSCQACDISGFLGTCTPVASGNPHGNRASCGNDATCAGTCAGKADGSCSYPTKNCGAGPSCAGSDKVIAQSICVSGACPTPTATACSGGYACASGACNAACTTSADCQADHFCYNQKCHSDVVSVALSSSQTCAALKDGRVMCWGEGRLGDGINHTTATGTPVQVSNLTNAQVVRACNGTACALTSSNTVSCWGGGYGQLGSGADAVSTTPVAVVTTTGAPLTGIASLYGGTNAFCAVDSTSTYCWGKNVGAGSLGFATPANPTSILSATPIQGASAFGLVAMGGNFQIGVQRARDVYPWGYGNQGTVSSVDGEFPAWDGQLFTLGVNITEVAAGAGHVCLLYVTGEVQCWGGSTYGQLGNGTGDGTPSSDPVPGHTIAGFAASHLAAGNGFTCAQTSPLSNIVCWGDNSSGILNADNVTNRYYTVPTAVPLGLSAGLTVKEVVAGGSARHICTIVSDGSLMCWGDNHSLQTGTGQTSNFVTGPSFVQANW